MELLESMDADDGTARVGSHEYGAWNLRKLLPSELVHLPALRWPEHVAVLTRQPEATLAKLRQAGDHPRLYAIGRALFTTHEAVREWIESHEVSPGFKARPATRRTTDGAHAPKPRKATKSTARDAQTRREA